LFGRQALPMVWDYVECNPLSGSSGAWNGSEKWILQVIENNSNLSKNVTIINSSATSIKYPDNYFDAIFTDPPYYNNVPYADLSDFFYVWLKRALGEIYPDLFSTPLTPKTLEICEMAGWDPKRYKNKDKEFFEENLSNSFKEMYRVLKENGIATIVYAHKTTEGWETVLNSLIKSGLVVTSSWPIHTEMKNRLRASSSAALISSIYMVCRKISRKKVGFFSEIQPLIKKRIEEKLNQFWGEGIAGGDFFISAIGPGIELFSRYEKVEKLSGESVSTSELLQYIRTVSTDFIVNKLLKNTSSTRIDNESEFYLAYRWTYLDNSVEYDDARKLASASGVDLENLWSLGGFIEKKGSNISVLGPKSRDKIEKTKNMVDVMHKSVLYWEKGDRENLSKLLFETGYGKDPAFKQFCQAIAESLINGNKEKQLLEGFLIGIDAYTRGKIKAPKDQTDLKQFGGS
jgi:putative DNA methylase